MQRLPPLDPDNFSARQKEVYDKIAGSPRGAVRGPFNVLLHTPDLADIVQGLGGQLRFSGALPGNLRELTVLVTARFWKSAYEWHAHAPIAAKEGVSADVIDAIRAGRTPELETGAEKAVYAFCRELHESRTVSDEVYANALAALGHEAVVELTVLLGHYTLISMVLNTFEVAMPEGKEYPFTD